MKYPQNPDELKQFIKDLHAKLYGEQKEDWPQNEDKVFVPDLGEEDKIKSYSKDK